MNSSVLQIGSKTTQDVVRFYYCWKKSAHYQMWREYGRPHREFNPLKEDQWKAVREKMAGFDSREARPAASSSAKDKK